jgi:hypothetical protein
MKNATTTNTETVWESGSQSHATSQQCLCCHKKLL